MKTFNNYIERLNIIKTLKILNETLYNLNIELYWATETDNKKQVKKINKQIAKTQKQIDFYTEKNHGLVIEYNFA